MFSVWEKLQFLNYDFIIVGGGLVGMHTALQLRKKYSAKKIGILERGIIPSGASTKNAGFACMGSLSELVSDGLSMTDDEITTLYLNRLNGLKMTRKLLGDKHISFRADGSYELITKDELKNLDHLDRINNMLYAQLKYKPFVLKDEIIKKYRFNSDSVLHAIENKGEGSIDTGKLMSSLRKLVFANDIHYYTGADVQNFERIANGYQVNIKSEFNNPLHISCHHLILCTNAFTKALIPDIDIQPGRGLVLITKPINKLYFKGIFHMTAGYYYFRNYKNCVLLGGGRHLDFKTETTTLFGDNDKILKQLHRLLKDVILPHLSFEIDYHWSGIMAFGQEKSPIVAQLDNHLFVAARGGGMGVALSPILAANLVKLIH